MAATTFLSTTPVGLLAAPVNALVGAIGMRDIEEECVVVGETGLRVEEWPIPVTVVELDQSCHPLLLVEIGETGVRDEDGTQSCHALLLVVVAGDTGVRDEEATQSCHALLLVVVAGDTGVRDEEGTQSCHAEDV
jgi:hypothetical protein